MDPTIFLIQQMVIYQISLYNIIYAKNVYNCKLLIKLWWLMKLFTHHRNI